MFHSPSTWTSNVTPLDILITQATNPSLPEPNYALHLEVANYIHEKKANTPRDAAMLIARLVNHRNPHIAMLSLALLETLVQSCGYPFHLQISTKEFLNELVRRFPERPPPFPGPVMSRILDLINDWKEGICTESRWKEDLGNIRDMHRLLTFKGYRFRPHPRQPPIASASNIKSAHELESEDREAQSAKLQELIRRGTPRDLAAAQELMKSLAGVDPEAKPDYRTQALTELNKLESKVILLNEILDNVDTSRGERFVTGDVYEQVASILSSARPKIQGWISNAETDDPESLNTFLQINDQINTVLNRYESYKKGDFTAAANPIPTEYASGNGVSESLIDFDDSTPSSSDAQVAPIDELASLFGPSTTNPILQTATPPVQLGTGTGAGIGMGMAPSAGTNMGGMMGMNMGNGTGVAMHAPTPSTSNGYGMSMIMGSSAPNQAARSGTVSPPHNPPYGSIRLPGTPQMHAQAVPAAPNYFTGTAPGSGIGVGASIGGQQRTMQPMHPQIQQQTAPPQQQQQQRRSQPPSQQHLAGTPAAPQTQGKDPFADLVGLF
ncbi:Probable ADP-ribosylation factor-binding protein [Sparassis crispa]|uniref:Probable ADP-ribosylation factor-binding protein n=1 Tax=Sparassis crispa TaxID=139825 RepID=A0A401GQB3_9APHY|nr:Probable ADP-ribosylation factor-binding protein [Sparassis crispa]GBE84339.1 Probable ADP-ribosylation factor-binding protein [Sparassis crispa]